MTSTSLPQRRPLACVILAAGQGTRMRSALPKVMHPIAGLPMIRHVIASCETLGAEKILVVLAPNMEEIRNIVKPYQVVIQESPLGTADAVRAAKDELACFQGDVIVLFGDTPLVTPQALQTLRETKHLTGAAIVVAGFKPENPAQYGRVILDENQHVARIVEAADATPTQKEITLCNGGIMLFEAQKLLSYLSEVKNHNVKGEYYLTDCIEIAREKGDLCAVAEMDSENVLGVNTRIELAAAEKIVQKRLRHKAMLAGATLLDPDSVYFSMDTEIGHDVTIGQNVIFGPGVRLSDGVEILPFCHLEGVLVESGARIGPFARLRPDTMIGEGCHIGNFVEVKKSCVHNGAKINHLSYIGDATVGEKTNIGAGTITCNYDGYEKHRTDIGAGAFIGSNSSLVAPVTIGEGAFIGAGSVITQTVDKDALAVARGPQKQFSFWARRYREAKQKKKS